MLAVVRVEGISALVIGLVATIILVFSIRYCIMWFKEALSEGSDGHFALGIISALVGILAAIFSFGTLLDVWNWVKIFSPEVALAKQILGVFLK